MVCVGVVVAVSCRRRMVEAVVFFSAAEAARGRQRVVMWVGVRVRSKGW